MLYWTKNLTSMSINMYFKTKTFGPMKAPGSCQEYYDNLIREDGDYPIQPSLDYDPFNVTCKFNLTSGTAQTILFHDHEQPFQFTSVPGGSDGCADPGCFKDKITYDANFDQLQVRDSRTSFLNENY